MDDLGRSSGEGGQNLDNWPPIGKRSFVERYLNSEINLAVRVRGHAEQWGAIFQFAKVEKLGNAPHSHDVNDAGAHVRFDQSSMLSLQVKLVKREDALVTSSVRLEVFDDSLIFGREAGIFRWLPLEHLKDRRALDCLVIPHPILLLRN